MDTKKTKLEQNKNSELKQEFKVILILSPLIYKFVRNKKSFLKIIFWADFQNFFYFFSNFKNIFFSTFNKYPLKVLIPIFFHPLFTPVNRDKTRWPRPPKV